MADNNAAAGGEEAIDDDELTEGLEKKKLSGKMMIIIGGAVVVLLIIVISVIMMLGGDDEEEATEDEVPEEQLIEPQAEAGEEEAPQAPVNPYTEPQDITVNMIDANGRSVLLTCTYVIEYDRQDYMDEAATKMARINNAIILHLRALRPEDLDGSAGPLLIQEELLIRINQEIAPARARRVLFQNGPNIFYN